MRRTAGALLALAALGLGSCSLDYGEAQLADRISDDTPDTVLYEFTHTIVRDGRPRFIVGADRAESFSQRKLQYLYRVAFQELARDGAVLTDGTADYAEYNTGTENLELSGNLRFYSASEDAWLAAEYLYWSADDRLLTSRPTEPVVVERGDGTRVRGRGFTAEMSTSTILFERGVSGTFTEGR